MSSHNPLGLRTLLFILVFIFLAQALAITLTHQLTLARPGVWEHEVLDGSIEGSLASVALLVLGAFSVTVFLLAIAKRKKWFIMRFFIIIILFLMALALTTVLLSTILTGVFHGAYAGLIAILIGGVVAIMAVYALANPKMPLTAATSSLIIAAEAGTFFAITLAFPTVLLLPLFFAVYDVYAVFKGPLGRLLESIDAKHLSLLSTRIGDVQIGMGDIVFYSMLPAVGLTLGGLMGAIVTSLATNVGVSLTLLLLSKRKFFPGLPLPVALGSIVLLSLL